jgi:hypothetical protein
MDSQLKISQPSMPSTNSLLILICFFNILDVILSLRLVTTTCTESNPFIVMLMCQYGTLPAFLGPKLFFLSLLAIGVFFTRKHSLFAQRMLCFIAMAYGLLVSYLIGLTISV